MGSSGWRTYHLEDVTDNFDSKRVPVKKPDRRPGPYPYYGASGVVDHVDQYVLDGEYLLVAEDGENLRTRKLPIAFIATGKFWVNNHAHIIRGNKLANTRFLGYCLNRLDISGYLSGSTMPKLTQGNMNRIRLQLPSKPVQDAIVEFLDSIDGKLALNRRMNRTLEKMAAAIFKSWFIDFDPVRAKADLPAGRQEAALPSAASGKWFVYALECEGGSVYIGHTEDLPRRFDQHLSGKGAEWTKTHPPIRVAHWEAFDTRKEAVLREKKLKTGSGREWLKAEIEKNRLVAQCSLPALPAGQAGDIADLFPDALEDSELGAIPKGWGISSVGDEFSLTMGQSPPGQTYNESREGTPFFQGRRDFGFRFPTNRVYCTAPTRFAARGDTLMSVRAPVGDVNMAIDRCSVGCGVAAARHKSTSISYTYYAFRSLRDRFEVYNGEGTVFGSISQKDLRAIPWLAPDDAVVSRFDQMAGPIDQRIELNEVQNRRLAGLRDTLLPKLLSGEIEVPEAEAIVEEVS